MQEDPDHNGVTEQRRAARKRLGDAVFLLNAPPDPEESWLSEKGPHARCAMYIAGYAIECKLKAIAMELNRCRTLQQLALKWKVDERAVYTHGLETLAKKLPLWNWMLGDKRIRMLFSGLVNRWRPSWRYDPTDARNRDAMAFVNAVKELYQWLDSNN